MRRLIVVVVVAGLSMLLALPFLGPKPVTQAVKPTPDPPGPVVPGEFKIRYWLYGVEKEPIENGEIVLFQGRIYQFVGRSNEVIVFDPPRRKVLLIDLPMKRMTDLSYDDLDEVIRSIRAETTGAIADLRKADTRAGRIEAEAEASLLDPRFQATYLEAERRLRLTNPVVEIDAVGEPDPDPARLAATGAALRVSTVLRRLRNPESLPPFPQLEALAAMVEGRKLRPTEMTFLFRLLGRPEKYRWEYELVPAISDRERGALAQVDDLLTRTRYMAFERYERRIDSADLP